MGRVIRLGDSTVANAPVNEPARGPIRTEAIHVVFTSIAETLEALRVAARLGAAMTVPVTVVHFRAIPYPLSLDAPAGLSPLETEEFVSRVRSEGIAARLRVFLCRNEERALPTAFRPHSLIVIGGRRRWWPTSVQRLRRRLESAGHFVVFVDTLPQKEIACA